MFFYYFTFVDIPDKGWKIEDGFLWNSTEDGFKCLNGRFINSNHVKDGYDHCRDGSDENGQ